MFEVNMEEDRRIIAAASAYNKKYFVNPEFKGLPRDVLSEVKDICVMYSDKLHCVFTVGFDGEGAVSFKASAGEDDYLYDEIGAALDIKRLAAEKKELVAALSLWHRVFVKGERLG